MKIFLSPLLFLLIIMFISCSENFDDMGNIDDLTQLEQFLLDEGDLFETKSFEKYNSLFAKESISNIDIPLAVLESVQRNFSNPQITSVKEFNSNLHEKKKHYSIFLNEGTEAVIFQGGQLLAKGTIEVNVSANEITIGELPFRPLLRLFSSYSNEMLEEVREHGPNFFEIDFKSGTSIDLNRRGSITRRGSDDDGDDDEDGIEINPANLPVSIHDYVTTNYPGETIVEAEQYPDGYEAELSNGLKLEFDLAGNFIEISGNAGGDDTPNGEDGEDIDPANLPQAIHDYVAANYPGETIAGAEQYPDGYEVTLSNGLKLEFDSDGNFIEVSGHSDDDQNDDDDDELIDPADLPQLIQDYITANYPNETIVRAELDQNGYDVILSNGLKLEFDSGGNFIEISGGDNNNDDDDDGDSDDGEDIDPASLPANILSFISNVCANETIVEAELSDTEYEVTMSNGLKFEFDLAGNFKDISGSDCDEIEIGDAPASILEWIEANFNSPIDKVKQCDFGYRIDLDDDTRIWLKSNGDVIFVGQDD